MANVIKQPINASNLSVSLRNFATIPNSFDETTRTLKPPRLNYITNAGDGTGRLYVNDQRGKMYVLSPQGRLLGTFLDLKSRLGSKFDVNDNEKGFTYFTFHPEYKTNGLFYTIHSELPVGNATFPYNREIQDYPFYDRSPYNGRSNHYDVLTEWQDNNPADNVFNGTSREILKIEQPGIGHNTGQIGFNPTAKPGSPDYGNLYIAVGDGGWETFIETATLNVIQTSQDLSSPLGKVLRINPGGNNGRNRQYGIPRDNPTDLRNRNRNALPEIYSYGHRNPHRFSWDLNTGKMLLAEINHESIDEVNLILPGKNYGWSQREGYYQPYPSNRFLDQPNRFLEQPIRSFPPNNPDGFTYPVVQYDHDYPGVAIAGGYVYQGTEIPYLKDQYVFADFSSDSRWFVSPSAQMVSGRQAPVERLRIVQNNREVSFLDILGKPRSDVRFGTDENNEIYVTNKQDGIIRKVVPSAEYLNRNPHILVQNFQIEEGNTVRYPITLVGAIQSPVIVSYRTTSNSGQVIQDFPNLQGTVTFTPSPQNQQTKYINIATRYDNSVEANENFWLNWQTTPRIPITAQTQVTIRNNDHEVVVGGALTVEEGGTFTIPLNLLGGVNEIIEIKYTLRSGTAQINDDLIVRRNTGSVIFDPRPNQTAPQPIVLRTRQDNLVESNEFFWLDLSSQQTRINKTVRLTITNDDLPSRSNLSNLNSVNPLAKDLEVLDFNPLSS
jgi:glucose/arabinose dehydrogenase